MLNTEHHIYDFHHSAHCHSAIVNGRDLILEFAYKPRKLTVLSEELPTRVAPYTEPNQQHNPEKPCPRRVEQDAHRLFDDRLSIYAEGFIGLRMRSRRLTMVRNESNTDNRAIF